MLGDRGDRNLKRKTKTKTNTKTKKQRKNNNNKNGYVAVLKILFHTIEIQWNFIQEFPLYFFLFLFLF